MGQSGIYADTGLQMQLKPRRDGSETATPRGPATGRASSRLLRGASSPLGRSAGVLCETLKNQPSTSKDCAQGGQSVNDSVSARDQLGLPHDHLGLFD